MERLGRLGDHVQTAAPAAAAAEAPLTPCDLLIHGGRVIDCANQIDEVCDVAVSDGHIVAVGPALARQYAARTTHDATGQLVTPGLVDAHGHFYRHCTPLGEPADEVCIGRGVTTAVDAGSAGATTFDGFRKFAAEPAQTRLLCILNASMHGLASAGSTGGGGGGELDSLNQVQVAPLVQVIEENRDMVVGIKVRLSADAANDGKNEEEAYRRALEACEAAGVLLMTHHTFSTVPLTQCPGADASPLKMRKGDLYTHTFHGFETTIIENGRVADAVWEAKRRGVLMDVGHGQGSFNWTVAKIATDEGFWPDILSTDIHRDSRHGPCYDLPTVITKWLMVGMPLVECIAKTTCRPAEAIGWGDRIGTLGVGRVADIACFEMVDVNVMLEDCQSQLRPCTKRMVCRAVWKGGEPGMLTQPKAWPNPETVALQRPAWELLEVRDETPPPLPSDEFLATLLTGDRLMLGGPADDSSSSAEGSGDWNPESGVAGLRRLMGSLLGESGRVWSVTKSGYVWNPIEYNITARRAAMAAACGCPVCIDPADVAAKIGDWSCRVVFDGAKSGEMVRY